MMGKAWKDKTAQLMAAEKQKRKGESPNIPFKDIFPVA
jgi:hypothetical protein